MYVSHKSPLALTALLKTAATYLCALTALFETAATFLCAPTALFETSATYLTCWFLIQLEPIWRVGFWYSWNLFDVLVVLVSIIGLASKTLPGATAVILHSRLLWYCAHITAVILRSHYYCDTAHACLMPTQQTLHPYPQSLDPRP